MIDTVLLDRSFTRDPHAVLYELRSLAPVAMDMGWEIDGTGTGNGGS